MGDREVSRSYFVRSKQSLQRCTRICREQSISGAEAALPARRDVVLNSVSQGRSATRWPLQSMTVLRPRREDGCSRIKASLTTVVRCPRVHVRVHRQPPGKSGGCGFRKATYFATNARICASYGCTRLCLSKGLMYPLLEHIGGCASGCSWPAVSMSFMSSNPSLLYCHVLFSSFFSLAP